MIVEISNESLAVAINTLGAELHSLQNRGTGEQILWQGDEQVWSGRAPILFPIVGALRHTVTQFAAHTVSLPKHGFARQSEFELVSQSENTVILILRSNTATLLNYPWQFELHVTFTLCERTVTVAYSVTNNSDSPMPFNIGSHPAFALNLEHHAHQDYSIAFEEIEDLSLHAVTDTGLLVSTTTPFALLDGRIQLTPEIFNHDALVFRNINSRQIHLFEKNHRKLTVDTGGAPHLGVWAKPRSAFVCIEPWWGHADLDNADDNLANKTSLQTLASNHVFTTDIRITL